MGDSLRQHEWWSFIASCCSVTAGRSLREVWSATSAAGDPKQPLGALPPLLKGGLSGRLWNPSCLAPESMLLLILLCCPPHTLRVCSGGCNPVAMKGLSRKRGHFVTKIWGLHSHRAQCQQCPEVVQSDGSGSKELNSNLPIQTHCSFTLNQAPSCHKNLVKLFSQYLNIYSILTKYEALC